MGWRTEESGFDFRQVWGIRLFSKASGTALSPAHPPSQWLGGQFYLERNRHGVKLVFHLLLLSAEIKNSWNYMFTHLCFFISRCLIKNKDSFIFHIAYSLNGEKQNGYLCLSFFSEISSAIIISCTNNGQDTSLLLGSTILIKYTL
jgi:hypothetical protein